MSTIDETQLFEDTINLDEVVASDENTVIIHDEVDESLFQTNRIEGVSAFQEQILLQEKSITEIRGILQNIQRKNTVMLYLGALVSALVIAVIAMFFFMTRSKDSLMFFLSLLSGFIALVAFGVALFEGFKFFQIRREMEVIDKKVLKDNAMNIDEKKQGLEAFDKLKEQLNGVTFLTTLVGADIKKAALEFQTLRYISDVDKARILELREHSTAIQSEVRKAIDQRKRLEEEIVNVTTNKQTYVSDLEYMNEEIRSIPTLKNNFGIAHDRYNNLGGEKAEQTLEHEWQVRVEEIEFALKTVQSEKEKVSEQLEILKKEAENKYKEAKNIKSDNDKKRNKLEQDKQNLLKKIQHAHTDLETASQNIINTNEKVREIETKMIHAQNEAERNQLTVQRGRLEDQLKKHMSISEKAKNFIDTSNVAEFDLRIASVQSDLLKHTKEMDDMIHFYEGEVNKLQNELNRKSREVIQTEETMHQRQLQRQEALRPFQEQVEIMLGLDKKIREIMQKDRVEKPSLEAKIAGVTQRIDNLTMEKSALETKVRDDKQRLDLVEAEIQNLSNNFIN